MATFISNSPTETQGFARDLSCKLESGSVIALKGELGSGKTQFVKGLAVGLGSTAQVTSPTFTLVHEYRDGRLPLYHLDLFRIENRASLERITLDEYVFATGVCAIEWADKFPELVPQNALWVSFDATSETQRTITVE